jgi:hypothetical protein
MVSKKKVRIRSAPLQWTLAPCDRRAAAAPGMTASVTATGCCAPQSLATPACAAAAATALAVWAAARCCCQVPPPNASPEAPFRPAHLSATPPAVSMPANDRPAAVDAGYGVLRRSVLDGEVMFDTEL